MAKQINNMIFRINSGFDRERAMEFINNPKIKIVQICEYSESNTIISIYYKELEFDLSI